MKNKCMHIETRHKFRSWTWNIQLPLIHMKKSTKIRRLLNGKHLIGAENQRFHSHALKKKSEWWECKTENCAVATVTTVSKINEIQ